MAKRQTATSLYIVATPIGNLGDLSPRAQETLKQVDWIAAEDTRRTAQLFQTLELTKPLHSLHEHSSTAKVQELIDKLKSGETGAYVTDAGTPGISDPGSELVKAAREAGLSISPIPGPSAVTTLLSASGFSGNSFTFQGFFPRENKDRKALLEKIKGQGGVHVFYESPHRIEEALKLISAETPNAALVIGRELTKVFEVIVEGKAENALNLLEAAGEQKGEYVFALEMPEPEERALATTLNTEKIFTAAVEEGASHRVLTAIGKALGLSKNEAYELGLKVLKKVAR